jgi:uncharacterized protein
MRPRLPEFKQPAILIFSKTNGFRDDVQIKAASAALEKMAKEKGWSSFTTENAAVFNTAQLGQFKAVVWSSVSGDVLTPNQRAALKAWFVRHRRKGRHHSLEQRRACRSYRKQF